MISSSPTDIQPVFDTDGGERGAALRSAIRARLPVRRRAAPFRRPPRAHDRRASRPCRPAFPSPPTAERSLAERSWTGDRPHRRRSERARVRAGATAEVAAVPKHSQRPDAAGRRPIGAITSRALEVRAVPGAADRPARDLRRPGRHRHRERPALQGAGGAEPRPHRGPGAADGDRARSCGSSAARRPTSSRSSTLSPRTPTRLCDADWALFYRFDGRVLRVIANHGAPPRLREWFSTGGQGAELPPDRASVSGRAAVELRTVHVPDVLKDPEYQMRGAQQRGGFWAGPACRCSGRQPRRSLLPGAQRAQAIQHDQIELLRPSRTRR